MILEVSDMSNGNADINENNGKKGGKPLLIVCALIIIVLLAVIIEVLLGKQKTDDKPKRNVVVNEDNAEDVAEDLFNHETVKPGTYEVRMNSTWNFKDGTSASENAYVENVPANTNDVYFDVELSDTEETIYESPVIPRGSHLEALTLDKELEAGTYDCVLTYHLIDEDQNTVSTLRMGLTVMVEN